MPPGFSISLYADVPNARAMALSPSGTLFVGTRSEGKVYAVLDNNKDNIADEVLTLASDLYMPVGVAFHDQDLYISSTDRIVKLENVE